MGLPVAILLTCIVSSAVAQRISSIEPFDPYRRLSDPVAISKLDRPDTLPMRIASGVFRSGIVDPTDGFDVLASDSGAGVISHMWFQYFDLPADTVVSIRIWIDDSLVLSSDLPQLFHRTHGPFRPPLDSDASGAFDCDVQLPYRRSFRVTQRTAPGQCCLFWGIEFRRVEDANSLGAPSLASETYDSMQRAAERRYHDASPDWKTNWKTLTHSNRAVGPLETFELADLPGPGRIREIVLQLDTAELAGLRDARIRMYWDGAPSPAVDVPLLDFFGCGAGFNAMHSIAIRSSPSGSLQCIFPCPFKVQARVELANRSLSAIHLIASVSYEAVSIDPNVDGYLFAQFHESRPAEWNRYHPVANALGRGRFVGVLYGMPDDPEPSFLEGNPYIYVDSNDANTIWYTGTEDYCNGGWYFLDSAFSLPFAGCTALWSSFYRFHYLDAIDFSKSLEFVQQHGKDNDFQTGYRTVAFLYRRWTPFWLSADTIRLGETVSFAGSGYAPFEPIRGSVDGLILFSTHARADGTFAQQLRLDLPSIVGPHRVDVNGYTRPEPIVVISTPTVRLRIDSVPPLLRYGDSVVASGNGFLPGERVRIFLGDQEQLPLGAPPRADSAYAWNAPIRIGWLADGPHILQARGEAGSSATARESYVTTRSLNYEFEDLHIVYQDGLSAIRSYMGWWPYEQWSDQTTCFFTPGKVGRLIRFAFNVPVSDTFRVQIWSTIGIRFGDYEVGIDSSAVAEFHGYFDTAFNVPFRSNALDAGAHFLESGLHTIAFVCRGQDPNAVDNLLNADNFVLTPETAFHPIRPPASLATHPAPHAMIVENLIDAASARIRVRLDAEFAFGKDRLAVDLFDALGRRIATLYEGSPLQSLIELTRVPHGLASGTYFLRARVTEGSGDYDFEQAVLVIR